ncbi:MAG: hypothetical protein KDE27_05760 [Planctomycetes bacterium]|nr:hypothetical protein [Planctomycetota bacterium]
MKIATAAGLSAALTSAATILVLQWPTERRQGWFELAGRPVALDGRPVQDWAHVNEILARHLSAAVEQTSLPASDEMLRKNLEWVFELDHAPDTAPDRRHRATVRQTLPQLYFWGGNVHPVAHARYEILGEESIER